MRMAIGAPTSTKAKTAEAVRPTPPRLHGNAIKATLCVINLCLLLRRSAAELSVRHGRSGMPQQADRQSAAPLGGCLAY